MKATSWLAAATLLVLASSAPALAEDEGRVTISIGGGVLATSSAPEGTFDFDHQLFGGEAGSFDADYGGGEASHYEASIAVRLRERFGLGLTWSTSVLDDDADIVGRLPHPFLHESHRTVEGTSGGLSRDETAVHLSLRWRVRAGEKSDLTFFGGPSHIELEYDLVTGVRFDQAYPFDRASYAGVDAETTSGDAVGFHIGAEIVRWLNETVGLGFLVRFSEASVDLNGPDGSTMAVDGGGLDAALELRFRF
ncbi:MAG: hypothetical protein OXG74_10040 [Acidobacteria bacterium]|nr:hypothetical protein [Acidobacteriota bacterium]